MTGKEKARLADAVKRMRDLTYSRGDHEWDADTHKLDSLAIIKAYLAEHLPDADESIDVEWLKAGGWEYVNDEGEDVWVICCESQIPAFSLEHDPESMCNSGYIGEYQNGDSWPHDIWTRGQLRDICRALGAPLRN